MRPSNGHENDLITQRQGGGCKKEAIKRRRRPAMCRRKNGGRERERERKWITDSRPGKVRVMQPLTANSQSGESHHVKLAGETEEKLVRCHSLARFVAGNRDGRSERAATNTIAIARD